MKISIKATSYLFTSSCFMALLFWGANKYNKTLQSTSHHDISSIQNNLNSRVKVADFIGPFVKKNHFPEFLNTDWQGSPGFTKVNYTLSSELQKEADRLLSSYKPDYGAITLLDAKTGKILAMSSFEKNNTEATNWNLAASFPAASVFKVVTATTAIDRAGVPPHHQIYYNGGAYTLYRKNVLSQQINRWTHEITLKEAFARSINTAFGRLSIEKIKPEDLQEYAERFFFNKEIPTDIPIERGVASVPQEKGFELAEVASGYNKMNRMSPIQGAMIAASIANDGQMMIPYIIESIETKNKKILYESEPLDHGQIMTPESSAKVRELMEQTVISGTSRKSFKNFFKDRKLSTIETGGKTGHLTGDSPKGRVDWFVGYAMDKENKVAIAAITVSKEFWTVKSSHLAQSMFRSYFKNPTLSLSKEEKGAEEMEDSTQYERSSQQ